MNKKRFLFLSVFLSGFIFSACAGNGLAQPDLTTGNPIEPLPAAPVKPPAGFRPDPQPQPAPHPPVAPAGLQPGQPAQQPLNPAFLAGGKTATDPTGCKDAVCYFQYINDRSFSIETNV